MNLPQPSLHIGRSLAAAVMLAGALLAEDAPAKLPIWLAPPDAATKVNPVRSDAASIAAGKELFIVACVPCHGPNGRGDGVAAPTLERDGKPIRPADLGDARIKKESDGALFWKISNGNNPMPAMQESLSETQRWQLVNYLRTLPAQAKAADAAARKSSLSGAEIYSMYCGRCHPERYPAERTAAQWKTIVLWMRVRANLPAAHVRTLSEYLQASSGTN
jgi:mono/diheme cytochrome c family protein